MVESCNGDYMGTPCIVETCYYSLEQGEVNHFEDGLFGFVAGVKSSNFTG